MTVSWMRKFALTVALFAVALILVGVAAAVHQPYPLFVMWLPLLAVPYVLTRPEAPPAEAIESPSEPEPVPRLEPSPDPAAEESAGAPVSRPDTGDRSPLDRPPAPEGPDRTAPAP